VRRQPWLVVDTLEKHNRVHQARNNALAGVMSSGFSPKASVIKMLPRLCARDQSSQTKTKSVHDLIAILVYSESLTRGSWLSFLMLRAGCLARG